MFRIVSKQLTFDQEKTRVLIQSTDGEYTAFEREIDGNHLATPDNDVIDLVLRKVYKDSFQKYAMSDAIEQADKTAEQVVNLKKTLDDSQVVIDEQRKQLKKTEELLEKASGAMLEQTDDNANISEHLLLVKYQVEQMAKVVTNFTLPTEVPEDYRERFESDKETEHKEEGDEEHATPH